MNNDRPSVKHMVLTLVGWGVGLLVVASIMVAISTAMAPKPTSDKAPVVSEATSTATAPVAATVTVPPVSTAPARMPVPVPAPSPKPRDSATPAKPLAGKVVVIDAGHQARGDSTLEPIGPGSSEMKPKVSSGASGVKTRNPEGLINLQVALRLQRELERRGARVLMVRTKQDVNISNSKRAAIANQANADLFIRLHCDGNSSSSMAGLSTLVPQSNKWTAPIVAESRRAASYVQKAAVSQTNANDRGVVDRGDLSGFNWAKVPTVLVEMGFLSNPSEDVKLSTSSYQTALAIGMATGIEEYLTSR